MNKRSDDGEPSLLKPATNSGTSSSSSSQTQSKSESRTPPTLSPYSNKHSTDVNYKSKITREEVYRSYDPWVGIRIAGFLGGMLVLLIVYIGIKAGRHRSKEAKRNYSLVKHAESGGGGGIDLSNHSPSPAAYTYPHVLPTVIVDSVEATANWVEDQPSEVSSLSDNLSIIIDDPDSPEHQAKRRASEGNIFGTRRTSYAGILKQPTRSKTLKEGRNLLKRYQVNFPSKNMAVEVQMADAETSSDCSPVHSAACAVDACGSKQEQTINNDRSASPSDLEVPKIRRPSFRSLRDLLTEVQIKLPKHSGSVDAGAKERLLDNVSLCNSVENSPVLPPRKARTLSFSLASSERLNLPEVSMWTRQHHRKRKSFDSTTMLDSDDRAPSEESQESHSSQGSYTALSSAAKKTSRSTVFLHPEDALTNNTRQSLLSAQSRSVSGSCLSQDDMCRTLYASKSHGSVLTAEKQPTKNRHGRKYSLL